MDHSNHFDEARLLEEACEVLDRIGVLGSAAPHGHVLDAGTGIRRLGDVIVEEIERAGRDS